MFSSDKNIETIGQLIEAIRHYIGLQTKYAKLDVIEKIVRLLTAFVMMITLAVLLMLMLIYASFAAAFALQPFIGAPPHSDGHDHRRLSAQQALRLQRSDAFQRHTAGRDRPRQAPPCHRGG